LRRFEPVRRRRSPVSGLLGALGLACAAIFPLEAMRRHADGVWAARVADWEAKLAAMAR